MVFLPGWVYQFFSKFLQLFLLSMVLFLQLLGVVLQLVFSFDPEIVTFTHFLQRPFQFFNSVFIHLIFLLLFPPISLNSPPQLPILILLLLQFQIEFLKMLMKFYQFRLLLRHGSWHLIYEILVLVEVVFGLSESLLGEDVFCLLFLVLAG